MHQCLIKPSHDYGIRNYQARNFMRDQMRVGDQVFFYHSSCEQPGIVGIAEVSKLAYPDVTQFDPGSKYFDPKATPEHPAGLTWMCGWSKKPAWLASGNCAATPSWRRC